MTTRGLSIRNDTLALLGLTKELANIWSQSLGATLWLPAAPQGCVNADTKFHCTLYM